MGTIDQFADDIPDLIAGMEKDFGDLRARALLLKGRSDDIKQRWNTHFDQQGSSLAAAEAAINRVSNIPLPSSQPSSQLANGIDPDPAVARLAGAMARRGTGT